MAINLQDAMWLLQPALQVGIVVVLFRSGAYRRLPLFFSYNIFNVLLISGLYSVNHWGSYKLYFFSYWSTAPIAHILEFAIVYEMFGALFRHREGLRDFGTMLFRWAILVMLLMGLVLMTSTVALNTPQFIKTVLSVERSIELMMVGLLLFLLAFSGHLGVTWRHKVFGIIAGWGLFSAVELVLYTERARMQFSVNTFNYLHLGAFDVMLLIWVAYAAMPEPMEVLPNMLLRSQRWNEVLLDNPQVEGEPTLLLGIESLVDRAMTRNTRTD